MSEGPAGGAEFHCRGMVFTLHDGPHGLPIGGLHNVNGMDGIGWHDRLVTKAEKDAWICRDRSDVSAGLSLRRCAGGKWCLEGGFLAERYTYPFFGADFSSQEYYVYCHVGLEET